MLTQILFDSRKKKKFKLSVLFSYYNNQKTIKKSLESIINQTFKNFEIIICSDGSTDRSDIIVKHLIENVDNILLLKSYKNNGLTKTLNHIMKFSSSEYIARHDADDYSHKQRLEYQINFLNVNKNISILGSNCIHKDKQKKKFIKMPSHYLSIKKTLAIKNPMIHSSIVIKSKVLKNNKYNQNFLRCQDYELWLRLKNKIRYHNLQKYLVTRNISGNKFKLKDFYFSGLARFKHLNFIKFATYTLKDFAYFIWNKIKL